MNNKMTLQGGWVAAVFLLSWCLQPGAAATTSLASWDLDMTFGVVRLFFRTTMLSTSLNASKVVIQDRPGVSYLYGSAIRLTGHVPYGPAYNATTIDVLLNQHDYTLLQITADMAKSVTDTYLRLETGALTSTAGVASQDVSSSSAMRVSTYTPDRIPPFVSTFTLDMNTGVLNITFSEPVYLPSFDITGITLQQERDKIMDPVWDEHADHPTFRHYTMVDVGWNITGVTHHHGGQWYHFHINDTYPYDYVDIIQGRPLNFTVTWDGHNYTYRADANQSYWYADDYDVGYGFTVTCYLGDTNLNALKALSPLAAKPQWVYLSSYKPFVKDLAGNNVSIATMQDTLAVPINDGGYVYDTTRPYLMSYAFDWHAGKMTMEFSETVSTAKWNVSSMCLQSTSNCLPPYSTNESFCLMPGVSAPRGGPAPTVTVMLGADDLNALKLLQPTGLFVSTSSAYLSFAASLTCDMAWWENLVVPVDQSMGMQASKVTTDTDSPLLNSFTADWNTRLLQLTFSESVDVGTMDVTLIMVQISANPGKYGVRHKLTSGSNVTSPSGVVVDVHIGFDDYAAIKLKPGLAIDKQSTYISFPRGMVKDMARPTPNRVVSVPASLGLHASAYTPDTSAPYLRGFVLDMDAGSLTLIFSEPVVLVDPRDTTTIALVSHATSYRLVDSSFEVGHSAQMEVGVLLSSSDLRSLKSATGMCRGMSDCFMVLEAGVVHDMNMARQVNYNTALEEPVPVTRYVEDTTGPAVNYFTVDMNDGTITVAFSEPVRASSLDCSRVRLHTHANASAAVHSNGNGSSAADSDTLGLTKWCINDNEDGDVLHLRPWPTDTAAMKCLPLFGRDTAHAYMWLLSNFVEDLFGNQMRAMNDSIQAKTIAPDLTPPRLIAFDLNKHEQKLRLYFDEPVNVSTLNPIALTLQADTTRVGLPFYNLPSSVYVNISASSQDFTMVALELPHAVEATIDAAMPRMGTSQYNTWLTMLKGAVRDLSLYGNKNVAVPDGGAMQLGPRLRYFFFDVDTAALTLVFSKEMDIDSFEVTGLTLHSQADGLGSSYQLTGEGSDANVEAVNNGTTIVVTVSQEDLFAIKTLQGLCVSADTTYLSMSAITVTDLAEHHTECCAPVHVVEIADTAPRNVKWFRPDVTRPRLTNWDLDLDSAYMSLTFDEPVKVESIVLNKFVVIHRNLTTHVRLTGNSTVTTGDGMTQIIKVQSGGGDAQELDKIKMMLSPLRGSVFFQVALSLDAGAVLDMAEPGNPIAAFARNDALLANPLGEDYTSPKLMYYDLNVDLQELSLVFEEVVNASAVDVEALRMHAYVDTPVRNQLNLTKSSTVVDTRDSAVIVIKISNRDMTRLKTRYPLLSGIDYVYLSSGGALVKDLAPQPNDFQGGGPWPVSTFIQDYSRPSVDAFDLDMDSGVLTLHFTEPVRPDSANLSGITLQKSNLTGVMTEWEYTLTASSELVTAEYGGAMVIQLGKVDMDGIKMRSGLALTGSTDLSTCSTWLRVGTDTSVSTAGGATRSVDMWSFTDIAGNPVNDVVDGDAIPVSGFVRDLTRPQLLAFSLYHDARLVLYFSEPVRIAGFNVTGISLENNHTQPSHYNLTHRTYVETRDDNSILTLDLSGDWSLNPMHGWGTTNADIADANKLGIGYTQLQTWLAASWYTCNDVAGNALDPISRQEKIEMGPIVSSYSLDMNRGTLNLTFNLPVFGGSMVKPWAISLQSAQGSNVHSATLTSCSTASSANSTQVTIFLCATDLAAIKSVQQLAVSRNSTWLTVSRTIPLTYSISTRPIDFFVRVVAIPARRALGATTFVRDITPPVLQSYSLHMSSKHLDLYFSEPVVLSTLNPSGVTVYGSEATEPYCILSSRVPQTATHSNVHVGIDLNVKDSVCVAVHNTGHLLTIKPEAGTDYAGNRIVEIEPIAPLSGTVTPDAVPPNLTGAILDLNTGLLRLNFSEVVDTSTLDASLLALEYRGTSPSQFVNLTSESLSFSEASSSVTVDLAFVFSDYASVLLASHYADVSTDLSAGFNSSQLYVHGRQGLVQDFDSNPFKSQVLGVDGVVSDTSSPSLLSFDLDVSAKTLIAYFDEPVNASTLAVSMITIQDAASSPSSSTTLSSSTVIYPDVPSRNVTVSLSTADATSLAFATTQANTYLSLGSAAIYDIAPTHNPVNSISVSDALQVGPVLHRAVLDMNEGYMLLVFSKPILFSTFDVTKILLVGDVSHNYVRLTTNVTAVTMRSWSSTTPYVQLVFGSVFFDSVKATAKLGKRMNETFVAVDGSSLAQDESGVYVTQAPSTDPVALHSFTPDSTQPEIKSIELDMNLGILNLTFSEPIDVGMSDLGLIVLQNTAEYSEQNGTVAVSFDSGDCSIKTTASYATRISIKIGPVAMAGLKYTAALATTVSNTYFTAVRNAFFDCAVPPNTASSVLRAHAQQLDVVARDTTHPKLLYYSWDLDTGVMMMYFNEPVDPASFNITGMTLSQYAYTGYGQSYRLSNYTSIWREDIGRTLGIHLGFRDWYEINKRAPMGHSGDETFLIMDNSTITDTAGNQVRAFKDGEGKLIWAFTPDATPPHLLSFTLNMDTGILVLTFSEIMDGSTFNAAGFMFESFDRSCFDYKFRGHLTSSCNSSSWAQYQSHKLTPSHTQYTGQNNETLTIVLSEFDLNAIKDLPLLCKSQQTTFLTVMPKAIKDMSGNSIVQIGGLLPSYDPSVISRGMPASLYVADTTEARLRSFDLNMNTGLLTLIFSETMPLQWANFSGVNLHNHPVTSYGKSWQLSAPARLTKGTTGFSNILYATLTQDDLNTLKVLGIGCRDTTRSKGFGQDDSVYITITRASFRDAMRLGCQTVLDGDVLDAVPMKVNKLTTDTTDPRLMRFTLEIPTKHLHLFFSEAIDKASLQVDGLQLLVEVNGRMKQLQLSSSREVPTLSPLHITLNLGAKGKNGAASDWDRLMSYIGVTHKYELYIASAEATVVDLAVPHNGLQTITSYMPLKQSAPSCTCPKGSYVVSTCTAIHDNVCARCSTCPNNTYLLVPCAAAADTQCQRCSECRYPFFASEACTPLTDTVCSPCTPCGEDQYLMEECTSVSDRQCGTCNVCHLLGEEQLAGCRHASQAWREKHCCRDSSGQPAACHELNYREFKREVVDGKRNWVFKKVVPHVPSEGQWMGNRYSWYADVGRKKRYP